MRKIVMYHLISLLSISLFLFPSVKWIASGKELPVRTQPFSDETVALKEITSFEYDSKIISLYYNKYSGIHFGEQNAPFINSLKPYCSIEENTCLYSDTENYIVMQHNEVIAPWKTIEYDEQNLIIQIYQLSASEEVLLLTDAAQPQYSVSCNDKTYCSAEKTVTIDEIKTYTEKLEEVSFSTIKQYRTQLKNFLSIVENWIHFQPSTGYRSSSYLSVSHHQIDVNKHILCISTGVSDYYLLSDAQWNQFLQLIHPH